MEYYFNQFLLTYFMYLSGECLFYLFLIRRYELKVSKKKAILLMLLCMNIMPITDALQLIIFGENLVNDYGIGLFIIKLTSTLNELSLIVYLLTICKRSWYQIYLWSVPMHIIFLSPVAILYSYFFGQQGNPDLYQMEVFAGGNLWIYICCILIVLLFGFVIIILSDYVKLSIPNIPWERFPKGVWLVLFMLWTTVILKLNKFLTEEQCNSALRRLNMQNILCFNPNITWLTKIILASVAILIVVSILVEYKFIKVENHLLKNMNKIHYGNYLCLERQQMEISKFYYVIGNHMETIRSLISNDDNDKADEYSRTLVEKYSNIKKYYVCDNEIINAVISQKLKYCDEHHIELKVDIEVPEEITIEDIDMMNIVSNLLDDAIAKCPVSGGDRRSAKITMECIGDYLAIKVFGNKEQRVVLRKGQELFTYKREKERQRYGAKVVDELITKYNGRMEREENDTGIFVLVLLLLEKT